MDQIRGRTKLSDIDKQYAPDLDALVEEERKTRSREFKKVIMDSAGIILERTTAGHL